MAPPLATPKPTAQRLAHEQQQDRAIAQLTKDKTRLANLARATLRLGQFQDQVMARAESWQIAARNVGSAYATAAKRHTDALAKQDKIQAAKTQLMFSVLTVATAGSLSWIASGLEMGKVLPERVQLIEAVEDSAQAGAGEVFSAMGPVLWTSQNQSVSIDPLVFQNERENAVSEARMKVLEHFGMIKVAWASAPLETWDNYNEAEQIAGHNAWIDEATQMAGKDLLPSIDVMADELERGIWAAWMPGLKTGTHTFVNAKTGYVSRVDDYASVGSAIEDRFDKLGILKLASVEIHWYQSAGSEDTKLIAWGQGYKVKDFLSLK
jgi:hypothetical protein